MIACRALCGGLPAALSRSGSEVVNCELANPEAAGIFGGFDQQAGHGSEPTLRIRFGILLARRRQSADTASSENHFRFDPGINDGTIGTCRRVTGDFIFHRLKRR